MSTQSYARKYCCMLKATIGFSRMLANSDFRSSLNALKNKNYTSNFTKKFYYNDATDFLSSSAAPSGSIFPGHPGVNVNASNKSDLLTRDIDRYTTGKNLRDYTTTAGKRAYDDRNLALKYYIELCQSSSGKSIGSYTEKYALTDYAPADNPSNSYYGTANGRDSSGYISGSQAYTETEWSTFLSTHKTDLLDNKKFAHLYFCYKTGNRTVNNIKGTYSRTRPFEVYQEASSKTDYDSNFSDGINGVDSDTAGLLTYTSYPSGHSGYFWGIAMSWASLFNLTDSEAKALFKRAYQYSQGRVIVGAHWQYCVEMGRLAGACGFAMMCANQLFINSLDTA